MDFIANNDSNANINIIDNDNKASLITKSIMLFYLMLSASYSRPIIGKQYKEYIQDNRLIKHLISFLTIAVLLSLVSNLSNTEVMQYAFVAYILFILTTKVDIHWNIMIVLLLIVYYFIERDYSQKIRENETDTTFDNEMRREYMERIKYKKYMYLTVIISTAFIGMYLYNNKKMGQYGGGYDPVHFFFY